MSKILAYGPKPNFLWSVLCVAIVLFLLGSLAIISQHSRSMANAFKEDFAITIELDPHFLDHELNELTRDLSSYTTTLKNSVVYKSKEDALSEMSDDLGIELSSLEMPNPLPDVVTFNINADDFSTNQISALCDEYERKHEIIHDIYYNEGAIRGILDNLGRISKVFVAAIGIFGLLALMLIVNSIRLAIYARRVILKKMELVGASWSFIRRPFLSQSGRMGIIASGIALIALAVAYFFMLTQFPELRQYLEEKFILYLIGGIVIISLLINVVTTWLVVTRYLKMSNSDLYIQH